MLIADLHIHSRYSRATSKDCTPEYLDLWARRKGIDMIGTGDFTHPAWRKELEEKLSPAEEGLYILNKKECITDDTAAGSIPRFVISGEISSIYKKNGRVRKVHNLILLPGLEQAEVLSRRLEAIGNLHSDGRPILGLDSRDLLEITLDVCPEAVFIPAHIWTPHFSLFGAFSGFDTIEECFEDLTGHIHALETGLSSDPPMNWRLKALDSYNLISNSDAHSPAKLGREANLLDIELSYTELSKALAGGAGFKGTIEFFPEEGKYHLDGHRKCSLCLTPKETIKYNGRCPVCGRKITIGVLHRVEDLADREEGFIPSNKPAFESLVPLSEAIAGSIGRTPASAKVTSTYMDMLRNLGPEFHILREAPLDEIQRTAGPCIAEGINRLRKGEVSRISGYDGEYGIIQLIEKDEIDILNGQISLFSPAGSTQSKTSQTSGIQDVLSQRKATEEELSCALDAAVSVDAQKEETMEAPAQKPNQEQEEAIRSPEPVIAVIAGPGTGKTKTLVSKIVHLIEERRIKPSEITAVTFTNKAARELKERMEEQLGGKSKIRSMTIGTFHSICQKLLSSWDFPFSLADQYELMDVAEEIIEKLKDIEYKTTAKKLLQNISRYKSSLMADEENCPEFIQACQLYCARLRELNLMDFDDLMLEVLNRMEEKRLEKSRELRRFHYLLIDEFQDINEIQYQLIKSWNTGGRGLFVIGDPDQSIYGFRGSNAQCFDRLKVDYPDIKEISLINNYRSTPQILNCALAVIEKSNGISRSLTACRKNGPMVRLITTESDMSEGIYIAKEINRLAGGIDMLDVQDVHQQMSQNKTRGFADTAVLYRTHRQAELIGHCLAREGIPYTVTGREDYLTDKQVRGAISFFRFLLEPGDFLAGKTFLKYIYGADEKTIGKFLAVWELYAENPLTKDILDKQKLHLENEGVSLDFTELCAYFLPKLTKEAPVKLVKEWLSRLKLKENKALEKLMNTVIFYKRMNEFLDTLILGQEGDLKRSAVRTYSSDSVSLMTLHGSKGLEFPIVFLAGVNDKLIPLEAPNGTQDPAEERRLLYVGMTRAKEELILITSKEPSCFLEDIPKKALFEARARKEKPAPEAEQLSLFDFL